MEGGKEEPEMALVKEYQLDLLLDFWSINTNLKLKIN